MRIGGVENLSFFWVIRKTVNYKKPRYRDNLAKNRVFKILLHSSYQWNEGSNLFKNWVSFLVATYFKSLKKNDTNKLFIKLVTYPCSLFYFDIKEESLASSLLNIICYQNWYQRKSGYMEQTYTSNLESTNPEPI